MNDETRLWEIDRMIDETTIDAHLSPEQSLVNELRGLGVIDWPTDEAAERITDGVTRTLRLASSKDRAQPAEEEAAAPVGRSRLWIPGRPGPWVAAGVAVAVVIVLAVFIIGPPPPAPSPSGRPTATGPVSVAGLSMRLVDSSTSPFQSVGSGPQSGDLLCVTVTVCYADEAGGSSGVERTEDGGTSWHMTAALPDQERFSGGPLSCPTIEVCVGAASSDEPPGATTSGGLQLTTTTDGGRKWSVESLPALPGLSGADIDQVSCATAMQCVVHVVGQSAGAAAVTGSFFSTQDAGRTWATGTVPPTPGATGLFTLRCVANDHCIGLAPTGSVSSGDGMDALRSTDGGRTWTVTSASVAIGEGVIVLSCGDADHCMMAYPSTDGGVMAVASTDDGGVTWQVTPAPSTWPTIAIALSCATAQDCFLSAARSTSGGGYEDPVIEATHDGGTTWTSLSLPLVNGTPLALVFPLSCPVGGGCIGVGATPQEFNGPVAVPKTAHGTLPAPGWVEVGQRVIISDLPAPGVPEGQKR